VLVEVEAVEVLMLAPPVVLVVVEQVVQGMVLLVQ